MPSQSLSADRIKAILVPVATLGTIFFNWNAAMGLINGLTPQTISDQYPTVVTPAGFAFTIWIAIYLGLAVFSFYQLLPQNAERFRGVRTLYIISCVLNCGWLYFWAFAFMGVCFAIILCLLIVLFLINVRLGKADSVIEALMMNAPFGLYLGWVIAAAVINLAVFMVYSGVDISVSTWNILGAALMLIAAIFAIFVRIKLKSYLAPLAVAWGLTGIAVKQSGNTTIVVVAVIGVIVCLVASLSFIMDVSSTKSEPPAATGG
jgi:hypothetical protein